MKKTARMWVPPVGGIGPFENLVTFEKGEIVPIIGPLHEDADLGFELPHWHINWPFLSPSIFDRLLCVIRRHYDRERLNGDWHVVGFVIQEDYVYPEELTMRGFPMREMLRHQPKHYWEISFLPDLEARMKGAKVGKCLKCPHKGIPLDSVPVIDGMRHCPGHGLRFNAKTGKLVPR